MSEQLTSCPYCGEMPGNAYHDDYVICACHRIEMPRKDWNRRFVCHDKNGDKVFAGDKVWFETSVGLYKGVVIWRANHADWVVLRKGDVVGGRGIRSDEIELVKEVK